MRMEALPWECQSDEIPPEFDHSTIMASASRPPDFGITSTGSSTHLARKHSDERLQIRLESSGLKLFYF